MRENLEGSRGKDAKKMGVMEKVMLVQTNFEPCQNFQPSSLDDADFPTPREIAQNRKRKMRSFVWEGNTIEPFSELGNNFVAS